MIRLAAAKQHLEAARAAGDPAELARALVAWAEVAPIFRFRSEPVSDALLEATRLLPSLGEPGWEGRCLLRLATVQMEQGLVDQAQKLATEAQARFTRAGDDEGRFRAELLRARALRRRGETSTADRMLAEAAAEAAQWASRRALSESFIALMLATGEAQVEANDPEAIKTLRALLNALDDARLEAFDARFTAHQGIALVADLTGRPDVALIHLRTVTTLVKAHDAPMDLVECRLALGTNLAAAGKSDEARRVLQSTVDLARDAGSERHRLLGLTGLAGVLSLQGSVKGAVDLAIATVAGYAKQGDTMGYVRGVTLAAHILLSHGRESSAIELLMYGASSLRHTVGEMAAKLLEAQIDAIHVKLGPARFEALCTEILDARAARKRLQET